MSKNWLTQWAEGKESAAGEKAQLAARQSEFARKVEQLRMASGKLESRKIHFMCARTGGQYYAAFERMNPASKFRIARIEKVMQEMASAGAAGAAKAPAVTSFNMGEFDWRELACPYCNNEDGFVRCSGCNQNVCQARTRMLPDGRTWFVCHESCGNSGETVPIHEVNGAANPRRGEASRAALPGRSQAALPGGGNVPRLGGPRS
jgi:hypothetical protein